MNSRSQVRLRRLKRAPDDCRAGFRCDERRSARSTRRRRTKPHSRTRLCRWEPTKSDGQCDRRARYVLRDPPATADNCYTAAAAVAAWRWAGAVCRVQGLVERHDVDHSVAWANLLAMQAFRAASHRVREV